MASDQGLHCLQIVCHFSLKICKSHSRMYLKLKLDSSNIYCERVYSVYNGLTVECNCILYMSILSTSYDTWCPHSSMTVQQVPNPAPFCPQILAGELLIMPTFCAKPLYFFYQKFYFMFNIHYANLLSFRILKWNIYKYMNIGNCYGDYLMCFSFFSIKTHFGYTKTLIFGGHFILVLAATDDLGKKCQNKTRCQYSINLNI